MTVSEMSKNNDLDRMDEQGEAAMTLRLAECLRDYVIQHGEANQAFFVLKALTILTIDRVKDGKSIRVTASNIAAEANIRVPDDKQSSSVISPLWNKLEAALRERESGIQDFARNYGLEYYPWPKKEASRGGRGANSMYYVESRQLPQKDGESLCELQFGEIAYIRELTPDTSWWAKRFLLNGYRLEGWRRRLVIIYALAIVMAGLTLVGLMVLISFVKFVFLPKMEIASLLFALGIIAVGLWLAFSPLDRLLTWRIMMAPEILIAFRETNVQIEIVREAHPVLGSPGVIRLIRYAGSCPVCHAKVELVKGGKEFPNRLIGRCIENPAEHVYSFDRFTCRGRSLR